MAIRFRKSVKLAPGVRMNVSGGGISWTLGVPGASVGIGRRRARAASKPATPAAIKLGVSIVVEDDGSVSFKDSAGNPLAEPLVNFAKRQHGPAIQQLIKDCCEKVNQQVAALGQLHLHTPDPTAREAFVPIAFGEPSPHEPSPRKPGFLDRMFKSRVQAIEYENDRAAARFERDMDAWIDAHARHQASEEARRRFLEESILTSVPAMECHLEDTLTDINWPRETQVSLDVSDHGKLVFIDVDLPEVEQLPTKTASIPARMYRLAVKELSSKQLRELYMKHVHGIGFRILGETFAALPAVEQVCLSAYTQRPDTATGKVFDEYLYSVRVTRAAWAEIDFGKIENIDVVEALARFELRRQMTKTGVFKAIEPFARDTTSAMSA